MRKYEILAAVASLPVLLSALSGCTVGAAAGIVPSVDSAPAEEPSGEFQAEQTSADSKKKTDPTWTFFIYAQGDNLHSPAFAADLASIKNAKLGKSVHVVVLADWNASITDASGKALFQPGADRFVFGGGAPRVEHDATERNFDDPAFLSRSIAQAFREYPATHRGLVIWSRGGGDVTRILGGDSDNGAKTNAQGMTALAMQSAIRSGLYDAGIRGDQPLDVLGFDISAAGRVEDAFAMKDLTKVFVSNASADGSHGWAYEEAFGFLGTTSDATAADFAKAEADAWNARAFEAGWLRRAHVAFDASKLDKLALATRSIVGATQIIPSSMDRFAAAAALATTDGGGENRRPDFKRFLDAFASGPNMGVVTAAAANASEVYASAVIGTASTTGFSVGVPTGGQMTNEWYNGYLASSQEWFIASDWNTMLASWFAAREKQPTFAFGATFEEAAASTDFGEAHGARIQVSLPHTAAVSTSITLKAGSGESFLFGPIGSAMFDGKTGSLAVSKRLPTVGHQTARAIQWPTSEGLKTALVGTITMGGKNVDAAVVLRDGASSSSVFVLDPETRSADAFSAAEILMVDPNATFTPVMKQIDGDIHNALAGTPIAITPAGVPTGTTPMSGGSYEMLVAAEDMWGLRSYAVRPLFITSQ